MDQGLDKSTQLSPSYRETFRRHRKLFSIPIILGVLAAVLSLFATGKTYNSTTSLWVDTAPPLPSSVSATTGNLAEPPASAAQAILSELLATRAFAVSVGETALHARSLGSAGATRANVAGLLGQGQLKQTVAGAQVLQLAYSASSPATAERVLAAIVDQLRNYINRSNAQHNQAAVAYNREQVKAAQTALASARGSVSAYQAQHPGVSPTDPNYLYLVSVEKDAAGQLAQANTALHQETGPSSVDGWSMDVIDPPTQAISAPLRKRKIAEVIVGGALGGLLVCFLAVVALTPAVKEEWEDELPTGGAFIPAVPPGDAFGAASPGVPTAPAPATPAATAGGPHRRLLGDRLFQMRTGAAPSEDE